MPADNNRESAGVLKAVPEQRPAIRSFPHVRNTCCGNDTKTRPPDKDRSPQPELTQHCVFFPTGDQHRSRVVLPPQPGQPPDGAVRRQPPGISCVKPERALFVGLSLPRYLNKECNVHPLSPRVGPFCRQTITFIYNLLVAGHLNVSEETI